MADTIFSTRLQSLRKERKVTQEQLADVLGVSPQAVSKWENGSYPDGDLIPQIAGYFDVSIDYLYGRAEKTITPEQMIIDALQKTDSNTEKIEQALDWCWAMQVGSFEKDADGYQKRPRREAAESVTGSKIVLNEGFSVQRFNEDMEYFVLMKEPAGGFTKYLSADDETAELFSVLGKKENLQILFYMQSLNGNEAVKESTIAKRLGISVEQVKNVMNYLCRIGLFVEGQILDEYDNIESVYQNYINDTYSAVMLLACAKNLLHPPVVQRIGSCARIRSWFDRQELDFLKKMEK